MKLTAAKTSMDGKTLHCWYDDDRECAFPYPIPAKVLSGRLEQYAKAAQTWLDDGNKPALIKTEAEAAAEKKANEYLAAAEMEAEKATAERAKEMATTDSADDAVAVLDDRISKLSATAVKK